MARPKRMGAYSALDDVRGERRQRSGRPWLEPVPALDDLPPGPRGRNALDELLPGPSTPPPPSPAPRGPRGRRHLEAWNPLDSLAPATPAPPAVPAKARVGFRLPGDLVEAARDAVAFLAGSGDRTTLTALTERALRAELARLAAAHNGGRPFPPRTR